MSAYAIWLDSTMTPPSATVAQIPDPLRQSNTQIGAYLLTQPTPNARCLGFLAAKNDGTGLPSLRWAPMP